MHEIGYKVIVIVRVHIIVHKTQIKHMTVIVIVPVLVSFVLVLVGKLIKLGLI
jgi:hypothetical protein